MMIQIKRPTTNIVSLKKKEGVKGTSFEDESSSETPSPFAIRPPDPLKAITQRKSRGFTEEEWLALLQKAFGSFAEEARSHLPKDLQAAEKTVRHRMLKEGFPASFASEASDEVVTALLNQRSTKQGS